VQWSARKSSFLNTLRCLRYGLTDFFKVSLWSFLPQPFRRDTSSNLVEPIQLFDFCFLPHSGKSQAGVETGKGLVLHNSGFDLQQEAVFGSFAKVLKDWRMGRDKLPNRRRRL
jgi:hypothetical protein